MFKFFKKKTAVEKLQDKYKLLLEESYKLSATDRRASDEKAYEAEQLLKEIEVLKEK